MKVLNFIWGYGPGGVDKCFLTYAKCGRVNQSLEVVSVCIFIEKEGVDLEALRRLGVKVFTAKSKYDFSWSHDFNAYVDARHFDLAFMHASHNTAAFLLARMRGFHRWIPIVRSCHCQLTRFSKIKRIKTLILTGIEWFILRVLARKVVAVSSAIKEELIDFGIPADKIVVVHNGVPELEHALERPALFPSRDAHTVSFISVSRLVKLKGVDDLLVAFSEVIRHGHNAQLIIVGDGPERESFVSLARKLNVDARVTFTGNIDNVADWLAYSDVYCLPSYTEAFPLGVLEAMRAGKPSIVSRVGGIAEAVTESEAVFINPGDVPAITKGMELLIENPALRHKFGISACERYLQNFTERKMMQNIADVLMSQGVAHA